MKIALIFGLFSLIFLTILNRHIFTTLFSSFGKSKQAVNVVSDEYLTELIQNKTGYTINKFFIVHSEKPFATMTGIPGKPVMTISKKMYDDFSKSELGYAALHEVGHYALKHSVKEFGLQLAVLMTSLLFVKFLEYKNTETLIVIAIVSSVIVAVAMIQVMRQFERQADDYALKRLDNAEAMITATKKLQNAWSGPDENSLIWLLFYRGVPYYQRIEVAGER